MIEVIFTHPGKPPEAHLFQGSVSSVINKIKKNAPFPSWVFLELKRKGQVVYPSPAGDVKIEVRTAAEPDVLAKPEPKAYRKGDVVILQGKEHTVPEDGYYDFSTVETKIITP